MNILDIKLELIKLLKENGLILEYKEDTDINLQDYIVDSIQFINVIVNIEDTFHIEWPDELCTYNHIKSLDYIAETIEELMRDGNK